MAGINPFPGALSALDSINNWRYEQAREDAIRQQIQYENYLQQQAERQFQAKKSVYEASEEQQRESQMPPKTGPAANLPVTSVPPGQDSRIPFQSLPPDLANAPPSPEAALQRGAGLGMEAPTRPLGWRATGLAGPSLGGTTPGAPDVSPAGTPTIPQRPAPPPPPPNILDDPQKVYHWARQHGKSVDEAVDMAEASVPIADRRHKQAIETMREEVLIEQKKAAVEREERERLNAQRGGVIRQTADITNLIAAGHGDPSKPLAEQTQEVKDYVAKKLEPIETKKGTWRSQVAGAASGQGNPLSKMSDSSKENYDDFLNTAAWRYINYNTLPFRKGKGGANDPNTLVIERAGKIARDLEMTPQELAAAPAEFKANAQSYAFQTKKVDAIEAQLRSFHNNISTWDSLAKGLPPAIGGERLQQMAGQLERIDFSDVKSFNDVKLRIQQEINDPTVAAYMVASMAVAMDYARIIQGPQSVASLTEGARADAERLVATGLNDKARQAVMGTLESDAQGQVRGAQQQLKEIRQRMLISREGIRAERPPSGSGGALSADEQKELDDLRRRHGGGSAAGT